MYWKGIHIVSHPLVRLVVIGFLIVTSFTAGMIANMGFGVMPLIGKADLLILLGFYTSIISAIAALFRYMLLNVYLVWRQEYTSDILNKIKVLQLVGAVLATGAIGYKFRGFLLGLNNVSTAAILAAILLMMSTVLYAYSLKRERKRIRPIVGNLLAVSGIIASYVSGITYVDVIRQSGPRVVVSFVDNRESRSTTFLLPAFEGHIVFYEGSPDTHYLPSTAIRSIVAPSSLASRLR